MEPHKEQLVILPCNIEGKIIIDSESILPGIYLHAHYTRSNGKEATVILENKNNKMIIINRQKLGEIVFPTRPIFSNRLINREDLIRKEIGKITTTDGENKTLKEI